MTKRLISLVAWLTATMAAVAAPPAGYYSKLDGIDDPSRLKTAVYNLISPHTHPEASGYSSYYSSLSTLFLQTDVYPDGSRLWWDMYSNIPFKTPSFKGLNREHSFPKSWWGGLTNIPAYVDLNHLYPAEADANMKKSNYPLGVVNTGEQGYFDNGVTRVGYAVSGQGGGAKYVFEPADEYKGDFARTYFYMVTCYQNLTWNTNYMYMLQQNTYPTLKPWAYSLLLEWSRNDPVSQKEIDRNEAVYSIQNNRNPFIDLPGLEEYIWGDRMGQTYHPDSSPVVPGNEAELFSPVDGMALDFGECAVGRSVDRRLLFLGKNLTGAVSVVISRSGDTDNRSQFAIESRSVNAELINSANGYYLAVTYAPTAVGCHQANLTVFDVAGWGGRSLNVLLIGQAVEPPALKQIKALPASDITEDSYQANWEAPTGDIVDYYIVNRTHMLDGKMVTDRLEAEETSLLITDYNPGDYDSYTVQSVRLGFESVPSNAITVTMGGVQGVSISEPLAVEVIDGTVRLICAMPQTDGRIYDITGRLRMALPAIERNMELQLPQGVYFLVTATHPEPVKILIR